MKNKGQSKQSIFWKFWIQIKNLLTWIITQIKPKSIERNTLAIYEWKQYNLKRKNQQTVNGSTLRYIKIKI